MANQLFAGFLFTNAGVPIENATVDLLTRLTTTPVLATTTTSATGYWAISYATEGRYDVRITNGSSVRWHMYDVSAQFTALEVQTLRVRNPALTFDYDLVPAAITADRQLNLPLITATRTLVANNTALADNESIIFGTGADASILYDGTNLVINPILVGAGVLDLAAGILELNNAARFDTGVAVVAASYSIGRDADATNQLHLNVPTGATFEWSVNDVAELTLSATNLALGTNTLTAAALLANSNDSGAIGASGTAFSDVFLASGAVIDFAAGDVTLTHAANLLTFAGGTFLIDATGAATAQLGTGTATNDYGRLDFVGNSASNGVTLGYLTFDNTRSGSRVTSATIEVAKQTTEASDKAYMALATHDGTSLAERVRITGAGSILPAGGAVTQSASATEIAFCVTNEALTVGNEGSVVIPYLSQTGALFTDTIGGNLNGAIGINYDSDTGPTSTIEVRVEGSWLSVAVTGYSINRRIPAANGINRETSWWHDAQIRDGFIDETICVVCGTQMVKGDAITLFANYERDRDLHAVFGHLRCAEQQAA